MFAGVGGGAVHIHVASAGWSSISRASAGLRFLGNQ
jgi:hypothetical protein